MTRDGIDLIELREKALALSLEVDKAVAEGLGRALGLGFPLGSLVVFDHSSLGGSQAVPSWGRGITVCAYGIPLWRVRVEFPTPRARLADEKLEVRVIGEPVTGGGLLPPIEDADVTRTG